MSVGILAQVSVRNSKVLEDAIMFIIDGDTPGRSQ
jgi:hypothetical protein